MPRRPNPFAIREAGGDIRDRDVSGFSWRKLEGTTLGEPGLGTLRRIISQRVPIVLAALLAVGVTVLTARLGYLQVVRGAHLRDVAEGNRIRIEVAPAQRGEVLDRRGRVLARNTPSFNLVVLPAGLPGDEAERQDLLNYVLGAVPTELLDQANVERLGELAYLPRVVATGLPRELALELKVRTAGSPSFSVVAVGERAYEGGEAVGHVVGYVGKLSPEEYAARRGSYQLTDSMGKAGLEAAYETTLRGRPGRRQLEVDALGRERNVYAAVAPLPGATLELTLDRDLQELAYRLLQGAAGARGGSIVALDPTNGDVLALASYPGFNPNTFTIERSTRALESLFANEARPLFNRAIAGQYPPGSTIKPLVAAAALNEHVITPQTTILSTGGVRVGDQFFADWRAGGHGPTNVYRAIADSVNTFFYLVAGGSDERQGLGISRLASYLRRFRLGQVTGADLPGETPGLVPTPQWKRDKFRDRWYRGDTYNVAIGQGNLTVTPLQLAQAYAAIANGGTFVTPHLVRAVRYPDGRVEQPPAAAPGYLELEPGVLEVVQTALRQTVTSGSARALSSLPLAVAGKTGTAQTAPARQPHAWFAGYAPAAAPRFLVVVMVEYGGEGSAIAVPLASELFSWYATHALP